MGELCPKCDLGQSRKSHTYRGSCRGLPPGVYFRPKGSKMIADTPTANPAPTTEIARRGSAESSSAISIELARRAEGQTVEAEGQSAHSPDEALEKLLAQGVRRDLVDTAFGMGTSSCLIFSSLDAYQSTERTCTAKFVW